MEHRGVEYRIIQGIKRGFWKWSVETETEKNSGTSDSRDAAMAAARRAIDNALEERQLPLCKSAERRSGAFDASADCAEVRLRSKVIARPHNLDCRLPSADRETSNLRVPVTIELTEKTASRRRSSERRSRLTPLGSIRHQIIFAAQNRLDVHCGASRGVGIRSARGQNT
jgi:hypothetical protein